MRYSINRQEENGLNLVLLKDEKSGTEVAVLPEFGGLLQGFSIFIGEELYNIVDHYCSQDQAREKIDSTFKSARLSPFTCRVAKGNYSFEGKDYQFKKRFMDGSA